MLKNLKIWQKLALIVVMMSVPVGTLAYLFVLSQNQRVSATRAELAGLEYITPLRGLLEHLSQHRAAQHVVLNGNAGRASELEPLRAKIEADFLAAEAAEQKVGGSFGTRQSLDNVRANWNSLKTTLPSINASESLETHTRLIGLVLEHVQLVGDKSQLLVDFQLDTAYLSRSLVSGLVRNAESVGQLFAYSAGVLARGRVESGEPTQMGFLSRQVRQSGENLRRDFRTAIRYNPKIEHRLSATVNSAVDSGSGFSVYVLDRLVNGNPAQADHNEFANKSSDALYQHFRLYDLASAVLNERLNERVASLNELTFQQLGLGGAILAFSFGLVVLLSGSITFQVRAITNMFKEIAMGNRSARCDVRSNDELGQMGRELNAMLDNTNVLIQSREERDHIQGSIQKLLEEVSGVAEGDLRKEAEVTTDITGAIADSFNYMISELRQLISSVQRTTYEVTQSARQVQATAETLADGSLTQSVQIQEASSEIDRMAQSIVQVSHTAQSAASVASHALRNAEEGTRSVNKTIEGMNAIRNQVQETSKRIKRLGESSQEIGEIVQLIGDITDRTSILALNASIQAAMAGDAGRGFAVVAEEVERLAERAAESTRKITSIIQSVQSDTGEAITAMEETTREVVSGSRLAIEAGQRLAQIEEVSRQISELVSQISLAAQQQAAGSETVSRNVTGISSVTLQTADGARHAASSIRRLTALAAELNESVSRFKLPEESRSGAYAA
jgi:methyl-accepting chemotaxis protein